MGEPLQAIQLLLQQTAFKEGEYGLIQFIEGSNLQ